MTPDDLTNESMSALADKVIDEQVIPKKIPAVDDVEGQKTAISGALASALLTATDMPLHTLQPVVADLAAQMVAFGVRQTDQVDPAAVHAPAWLTDGVRKEAVKLPDPPQHTDAEPYVARTAVAPAPPKRIKSAARAVRQ
ncbi:hypothetical protein [Tsukamurella sp. 1534]|uniref:hypothetical protein n=1 Tax=Tsukamurella sp. 1534 TaxID=1151061 RepID=UPI000593FEF4|nr:hypothetical protein [Tsukamurella sp. 1534]